MKHFTLALMAAAALSTAAIAQNKVTYVSANSSRLNMEMVQQTEQTVQLSRYLFAGYNTLCLPMSVSAEQLAQDGITVERLAAIGQEGSTLNLYFVDCTAEGIQAGYPYLVYSQKTQSLRVRNTDAMTISSDLQTVRMNDNQGNQVSFSSSWESIEQVGRYGIPAQQNVTPLESVLVRTEADKTFLPTRCGFTWETQSPTAQELRIQHVTMADVTAINATLMNGERVNGEIYDLNGRRVTNMTRPGVYVVNGSTVIVK